MDELSHEPQAISPLPQPEDQPKLRRQSRFLLLAASGVVLLGLVFLGYYLIWGNKNEPKPSQQHVVATKPTPTLDPTINWKTYTSLKNNFSFKYPSSWSKDVSEPDSEVVLSATQEKGVGGGLNGVSVSVLDNPNSLSVEQFIKKDPYNMYNLSHFAKNSDSLGISTDWMIDRNSPGAGSLMEEVLIANGTKIIDITSGSLTKQQVDQILSTFKFTDQDRAEDTTNWKTYNGYGFLIKYPPNWYVFSQKPLEYGGNNIVVYEFKNTNNIDGPSLNNPDEVDLAIDLHPTTYKDVLLLIQSLKVGEQVTQSHTMYTRKPNIFIDSGKAVQYSEKNQKVVSVLPSSNSILVQHNGLFYHMQLVGSSQMAIDKNVNLAYSILSTFKFTQ